jgi:hypothetical protein
MHAFALIEMDPHCQKGVVQFGPLLQLLNILRNTTEMGHNGILWPLFQGI